MELIDIVVPQNRLFPQKQFKNFSNGFGRLTLLSGKCNWVKLMPIVGRSVDPKADRFIWDINRESVAERQNGAAMTFQIVKQNDKYVVRSSLIGP
jgi:hypothetical protein